MSGGFEGTRTAECTAKEPGLGASKVWASFVVWLVTGSSGEHRSKGTRGAARRQEKVAMIPRLRLFLSPLLGPEATDGHRSRRSLTLSTRLSAVLTALLTDNSFVFKAQQSSKVGQCSKESAKYKGRTDSAKRARTGRQCGRGKEEKLSSEQ